MNVPVTTLDRQYSDPAAVAVGWEWDGRWQFAVGAGGFRDPDAGEGQSRAQVFSVTPAKVFAHAKGDPFGATRHKF